MAEILGRNESTIQKTVTELKRLGIIEIKRNKVGYNKTQNHYKFTNKFFEKVDELDMMAKAKRNNYNQNSSYDSQSSIYNDGEEEEL
jgi:DNA-binding transcriptional regulator YhcF (GntR family)